MNAPLTDDDLDALQQGLADLPPPLEPLGLPSLDGFLCGVLLQPQLIPTSDWLRYTTDLEGRPLPPGAQATGLQTLIARRHAELERAIATRQWFDPWVLAPEDDEPPSEAVRPWVAGFAAAMDLFPALMRIEDPALIEPLAVLYLHFDPEELEDADALLAVIETLEPPADMAEAVEDLVRSVLLIADVSRPRTAPPPRRMPRRAAR